MSLSVASRRIWVSGLHWTTSLTGRAAFANLCPRSRGSANHQQVSSSGEGGLLAPRSRLMPQLERAFCRTFKMIPDSKPLMCIFIQPELTCIRGTGPSWELVCLTWPENYPAKYLRLSPVLFKLWFLKLRNTPFLASMKHRSSLHVLGNVTCDFWVCFSRVCTGWKIIFKRCLSIKWTFNVNACGYVTLW